MTISAWGIDHGSEDISKYINGNKADYEPAPKRQRVAGQVLGAVGAAGILGESTAAALGRGTRRGRAVTRLAGGAALGGGLVLTAHRKKREQ